ncbi:MAG: hypothetical protein PF574_04695 [Candidatus Delongbacteria bacterium]|nr:hypothetical protein [Candidatus Delongbacteria bacterium]
MEEKKSNANKIENVELIKNLEFLSLRSDDLLQEQLKSYNSAITKASIVMPLSSLILPFVIEIMTDNTVVDTIRCLCVTPFILIIIGLYFLIKVLIPKGLDHGFNFDQFDKHIDQPYKDLLLYKIGSMKDSYNDNQKIVNKQNFYFKIGLLCVFIGILLVSLLSIINYNLI